MVDPLDNLASSEQLKRLLLQEEQERLDRLEVRLGDDDALKSSLIPIIAEVLRDAGVRDYRRLADALAPIVLQSIKTEIQNSRDMMVDALYPITGRLVAAAVRNAFKDLVDQLNSKLDSTLSVDRWRAKVKAKLSGRSEAEILLSEGAAFEIVDLLLINRQSGLLIAQAVVDDDEDHAGSHLLSSILTAIMAFVRDAMSESSEQDLRTLHVGDVRLHLQISPNVILAVKTKGPPPAGFETALSETFYAFLSRWGKALSEPDKIDSHEKVALTEDLEERFNGLVEAKHANFKKPSRKGAMLLGILAALAILWIGWSVYDDWSNRQIEAMAQAVIDRQVELKGYPIDVSYNDGSDTLAISGLFPSQRSLEGLRRNLKGKLRDMPLSMNASWLPDAEIDLDGISTKADLADTEARLYDEMSSAQARMRDGLSQKLAAALSESQATSATSRQEMIGALNDRISMLSKVIASIEQRLPTAADQELSVFGSWLTHQSVRFEDDRELHDVLSANEKVKDIAHRMSALPGYIGLRVVGYGDELGEDSVSTRISRLRAALVGDMLKSHGVTSERLQIVGRGNEKRIIDIDGTSSINRRVEFEVFYLNTDRYQKRSIEQRPE
jgi:outer membrane protein OmpA-like peptidoglycan-associated protein